MVSFITENQSKQEYVSEKFISKIRDLLYPLILF